MAAWARRWRNVLFASGALATFLGGDANARAQNGESATSVPEESGPSTQQQIEEAAQNTGGSVENDNPQPNETRSEVATPVQMQANTRVVATAHPSRPEPTAPTVSTPEAHVTVAGVPIRFNGILHAMVVGTQGVQSFGFATAVAPTSALNPAILANPNDGDLSFQVQQTRLGMIVGEGTDFRGQVEVDFVHFDQSTPAAQAFPRIRIALLEWHFKEDQKVFLGQTWDLFGNAIGPQLLSHSFNLVGTMFQAGNIGFMRHQLGWSGRFGKAEFAAAAGFQGVNTGPSFNNLEQSFTPTGAARAMLHIGDAGAIGISGIVTSLRFSMGTDRDRRIAAGGQLFADLTYRALSVHGELYIAQNLANTGALNIGQGRFGHDVADAGGYISGKLTLGKHAFTAMFGAAAVLRPGEVVPGYTAATMTATVGTPNTAAGPGMTYNLSAHVGYWLSPIRGMSIVLEPYVYATRFVFDPADVARFSRDRVAWGGTLGSMFQF